MFTVGILTISDKGSRGEREDESGAAIREMLEGISAEVTQYEVIPDEKGEISGKLIEWADGERVDLIFTTGGTGLAPRDVTPEATLAVIDRLAPGFAEAMRAESIRITPKGMLSRGVAGTLGKTLIINLPGSPKAVRECLEAILAALPHGIEMLTGKGSECATKDN